MKDGKDLIIFLKLQIGIPTHDKIYSPETCIFIEANKNKIQMIKDNFNNESGYYGVRIFNGIYKVYLGSSKMNTKEFSELLDECIKLASEVGVEYEEYYAD